MTKKYVITGKSEPRSYKFVVIKTTDIIPSKRSISQYARHWYMVTVREIRRDKQGRICFSDPIYIDQESDYRKAGMC